MNWINAKDRLPEETTHQGLIFMMELLIAERKRLLHLPIDDIPKPGMK